MALNILVSELNTPDVKQQTERMLPQVRAEMRDFMDRVNDALRGVEFAFQYNWAWVYRTGDTHALGRIGYGDMLKGVTGENQYGVYSRHITNEKYASGQDFYHIRASRNIDVAVRNAKTYMRPFTAEEAEQTVYRFLHRAVEDRRTAARREYENHMAKAMMDNSSFSAQGLLRARLLKELEMMVQSGAEFFDQSLKADLIQMLQAKDAFVAVDTNIKKGFYYVRLVDNFGQTVATVLQRSGYNTQELYKCDVDHLPAYLAGKLSVLTMLEPVNYVPGVGMKVDPQQFYVEVETPCPE